MWCLYRPNTCGKQTAGLWAEKTKEFMDVCWQDFHQLCTDSESRRRPLECLRSRKEEVKGQRCRKLLFEREKVEAADPQFDYHLQKMCRGAIKEFCSESHPDELISCLIDNKNDLPKVCREILKQRQMEYAGDIR